MKFINLGNGKVRLQPDDGKILYCELDKQEHSEAVVKEEKIGFFAEKTKEEVNDEETEEENHEQV